ncbi:MAG: TetR/AcrR family transcriptional regulator [Eggerthellaceae bacterium]|nr:TetR/AcrR family transcriptional regulator [Eggerthellaceae bacterium]
MGKYEDMRSAALEIMSEGGARALTLPLLFERAHTGAGTFYHYFKDREDLIEAVFRHCYDVAERELAETDDPSAPTRERFDALCRHMFHAYVVYPQELNFLYWYTFGYVEPDSTRCRIIPSVMLLTAIIDAAQKEGLVRTSAAPSVMARVVRGMVASVFWGHERAAYVMDEDAAQRFANSAWRAIEEF